MRHPNQKTKLALFDLFRRKPWAVILAVLLVSLLVAEIVLQLTIRKTWTTYAGLESVSAIAVDGQGQAWVAGYRKNVPSLMRYSQNGRSIEVPMPGELTRTAASALMIDSEDRLWVGTEEGMVGMRNGDAPWVLYAPEVYGNDSIQQLVMDGQGRVWVRSHRGPARIDPASSERTLTFTNASMTGSDAVALAIDQQGQLWGLTRERELKVLEADDNWRTVVIVPDTVRNGFVDAFLTFDPQGQMWLATVQGVGVLSLDGAWKEHPLGDPYRPLSLGEAVADAEGRVWVAAFQPRNSDAASFSGLFVFDPQEGWAKHSGPSSGLSIGAEVMALDPQGQVWMGSMSGELSRFNLRAALPGNIVSPIRMIARTIVPAALLSVAVLGILAFVFRSPTKADERKMVEFSLAFAGWFVIATLLWVYVRYAQAESGGLLFINPLALFPPVVNLLLMIVFYGLRRLMAWGAVCAFLVNWIGLILVTPATYPFGGAQFLESVLMLPFFLPGS